MFDVSCEWLGDRGILRLRVKQTPDTSRGAPVYRTPVVFGVHTARGRRSQRVWLERAEEFSRGPVADWIAVNRETLARIHELPPTEDLDERIDRRILERQARIELERWELGAGSSGAGRRS